MVVAYALPVEVVEGSLPSIFREVGLSFEFELRKNAIVEENESFHMNDTWKVVEFPKGKKAIGCKWVFAKKERSPDATVRCKARLVAKGYAQREGIITTRYSRLL